jgi:hypothetical protein
VTFFEGCTHIGKGGFRTTLSAREVTSVVSRAVQASIGPVNPGLFGGREGLDIATTGPTVRWVSSRGLASLESGGGFGDERSGGRGRVQESRGFRVSPQRCESCPVGVQHSPNGGGTRTVEVVRNHEGGSRFAARGGGGSSVSAAQAVHGWSISGSTEAGCHSRANLQERRFRSRTAMPYPRGREERSSAM